MPLSEPDRQQTSFDHHIHDLYLHADVGEVAFVLFGGEDLRR